MSSVAPPVTVDGQRARATVTQPIFNGTYIMLTVFLRIFYFHMFGYSSDEKLYVTQSPNHLVMHTVSMRIGPIFAVAATKQSSRVPGIL
jgi:hypothetical protein